MPPRLHPVVAAAARGDLPSWAEVGEERLRHVRRVSELLGRWAEEAGLPDTDRHRWVAAGYLHDALKEADAERLRREIATGGARFPVDLPEPVLHGPAAAARLAREGVEDEELLGAVAWHSLGHEELGPLGFALYAADFLEPGRKSRARWRDGLRERMPDDMDEVVREILRARIVHLLDEGRPVRPETMALWNHLNGGDSWARASEV